MRSLALILITLTASLLLAADGKSALPKHTEIEGMNNFLALKYLPEERYSGDLTAPRGDYEMLLSLHVPKEGKGPFPVVFYVHGGGYGAGTKEGGQQIAKELAKRGIAYCGFNYILQPKGIFPQCWWDFHNAARYLRKHAEKYNLDPLRFGAFGISAGGWLISSASLPSGDYVASAVQRAEHVPTLVAQGGKNGTNRPDGEWAWLKPMRDPAPAWPGEAGGFSALSWDFYYHVNYGDNSAPAIQQWAGQGNAKPSYFDALTKAGGRITITELTDPKCAGKSVHVPPFFNRGDGAGEADALDLDGKPGKTLGLVVADFFARELLGPNARVPAPEIYPIPRIINAPTAVTMLAPRGATIHYTLDGTAPTPTSPTYQAAISVGPGTTVKAITVASGLQPSGVYSAEFVAGTPAPSVTGPAVLPPGATGQPYSVTFTADKPKVRRNLQGDLVSSVPIHKTDTIYPNNMKFDAATGTWSGTPTLPGSYWVQVWVAEGPGMVAGYRNYRWTVTGKALEKPAPQVAQDDQNQPLVTLKRWPADKTKDLLGELTKAKLRALSPNEPGDAQVMILVPAADQTAAQTVLKNFLLHQPAELGLVGKCAFHF